jgi:N-acetylglucosamine kinase-like BadF-type ATPase
MRWIVGIDGGGTRTVACAADLSGRVLARAEGGPANYHTVGLPAFADLVAGLVADLARAAALDQTGLALVSLGLAGADRDHDRRLLLAALDRLGLGCPFLIDSDARIALAAGLGERGAGIVLIAGTGSIAYGLTAKGEVVRAGGWGHIVGDEGSGYDIGRQAIARGLRAHEGRDIPSVLLDKIIARLGVADQAGLIAFVYSPATAKADIAALAATVAEAAADGDRLAAAILARRRRRPRRPRPVGHRPRLPRYRPRSRRHLRRPPPRLPPPPRPHRRPPGRPRRTSPSRPRTGYGRPQNWI